MIPESFIQDLLDPSIIASTYETSYDETLPFLGSQFFGEKTTSKFELSFLKGAKGVSATSRLSDFDANYTLIGRGDYSKLRTEFPFFREGAQLTEDDIIQLNSVYTSYGSDSSQMVALVKRIYDDRFELINRGKNTVELMRWQILQTAGVSITTANALTNKAFTITYDPDGTWASTNVIGVSTPWSNATATPIKDLVNAIKAAKRKNGTIIKKVVLSDLAETQLLDAASTEQLVFPQYSQGIVGLDDVSRYISKKTNGVQLISMGDYHNYYRRESDDAIVPFLQDDRVVLLPNGVVGDVYSAPTPAQLFKARFPERRVSEVDGFTIGHYCDNNDEPALDKTVASFRKMASFEGMDSVYNIETS